MPSSVFVQKSFLSLDALQLGRLVVNKVSPQQDFLDPWVGRQPDKTVLDETDFQSVLDNSTTSTFSIKLSGLLNINHGTEKKSLVSISASKALKYEIQNSGVWFSEACSLPSVRQWLEKAVENYSHAYLIVGYQTLVDAQVTVDFKKVGSVGAGVETAAIGSALGIPSDAVLLDHGLEGSHTTNKGYSKTFFCQGEKVYAIAFRRIRFNWFASKKVSESFLSENTKWKICWSARGPGDPEEPDILEAALTDENDSEDNEDSDEAGFDMTMGRTDII